MDYNNMSSEDLGRMVENILNGNPADLGIGANTGYIDERAEAFIKSLKDMVN